LIFYCPLGGSENKQEVMGRMMVLRDLLAKHAKEHEQRMIKLNDALKAKLNKVKKEHLLLASKQKKIQERLLE
jgi:hypothetical protein